MNELESWIWIILSVGVPFVFILACINTKPHASHIWEMKRVLEANIQVDAKGNVLPPRKKFWEFLK